MNKAEILEFIEANQDDYEMMCEIRLACDKNVKLINSNVKGAITTLKYQPEALGLSEALQDSVLERYPFMEKKISVEMWAEDIDKLERLDGHSWPLIEAVMEWSQDDEFWRQQVRSGNNLRKHFDNMLIRIKENEDTRARIYDL